MEVRVHARVPVICFSHQISGAFLTFTLEIHACSCLKACLWLLHAVSFLNEHASPLKRHKLTVRDVLGRVVVMVLLCHSSVFGCN
jgi:hypothetical protein